MFCLCTGRTVRAYAKEFRDYRRVHDCIEGKFKLAERRDIGKLIIEEADLLMDFKLWMKTQLHLTVDAAWKYINHTLLPNTDPEVCHAMLYLCTCVCACVCVDMRLFAMSVRSQRVILILASLCSC